MHEEKNVEDQITVRDKAQETRWREQQMYEEKNVEDQITVRDQATQRRREQMHEETTL